jgi:hypothetical protein
VLPVYQIHRDPEVTVTMRDNFYNWKISVDAHLPVKDIFYTLINREEVIRPVYCEGFKEEWVYGSFKQNARHFTVEMHSDYGVWAFLFLLSTALGFRKEA